MKKLLFIFLLFHSFNSMSQYNLTIQGHVTDKSLGIDVRNPEVSIMSTKGDRFETKGDSSGFFSLTTSLEYDTLVAILTIHARTQMTSREKLHVILNSDTTIKLELSMPPQEICHDSFLPSPIFFKANSDSIKDQGLVSELKQFASEKNNDFLNDALSVKSGIVLYSVQGYNEREGTAKMRAEYISEIFSSNSVLNENIEIIIINQDDYFYCTHCDGCFEYFKYGQGIELNKETINKFPQLDQVRQIVEIQWKGNKN